MMKRWFVKKCFSTHKKICKKLFRENTKKISDVFLERIHFAYRKAIEYISKYANILKSPQFNVVSFVGEYFKKFAIKKYKEVLKFLFLAMMYT